MFVVGILQQAEHHKSKIPDEKKSVEIMCKNILSLHIT